MRKSELFYSSRFPFFVYFICLLCVCDTFFIFISSSSSKSVGVPVGEGGREPEKDPFRNKTHKHILAVDGQIACAHVTALTGPFDSFLCVGGPREAAPPSLWNQTHLGWH